VRPARGQLLLIAGLLVSYTLTTSRALFPAEESPISLLAAPGKVIVELGDGFLSPGIHQYIDGSTRGDVIILTNCEVSCESAGSDESKIPLLSGARLDILGKTTISREVRASWMTAAKRVALGIPLHPDRMSQADWLVLPGIGASMAEKIEKNRQKYGDFGSFENLKRVPGIGVKRLSNWNQYFFRI